MRRLSPRKRDRDSTTGPSPRSATRGASRARGCAASTLPRAAGPAPASVHLVVPRSFNDAQQIADKFKEAIPVILNLQGSDAELSKRLIDFASGLTYALEGGMQRVADKVFLLTPRNVEVSAEERARLLERGGFFNQADRKRRRPRRTRSLMGVTAAVRRCSQTRSRPSRASSTSSSASTSS